MRSTVSPRPVRMMIPIPDSLRSERARVRPSSPGSIRSRMTRSTCALRDHAPHPGAVMRGRYAIAFAGQIFLHDVADFLLIVDDQDMAVLGHLGDLCLAWPLLLMSKRTNEAAAATYSAPHRWLQFLTQNRSALTSSDYSPPIKSRLSSDRPIGRSRVSGREFRDRNLSEHRSRDPAPAALCARPGARCRRRRMTSSRIVWPARSENSISGRKERICGRGCSRFSTINMSTRSAARCARARRSGSARPSRC